jgi:hypothetical protein
VYDAVVVAVFGTIEPYPDAPPFTLHVYGAVPPETVNERLPRNAIWVAADGLMLSVSIVTLAQLCAVGLA